VPEPEPKVDDRLHVHHRANGVSLRWRGIELSDHASNLEHTGREEVRVTLVFTETVITHEPKPDPPEVAALRKILDDIDADGGAVPGTVLDRVGQTARVGIAVWERDR
jgi:hypothetical protein